MTIFHLLQQSYQDSLEQTRLGLDFNLDAKRYLEQSRLDRTRRSEARLAQLDFNRVLPRFCGHLIKAHNGPGGCHDTEAEIFSGVQA
jgi:hypothetical protein